MPSKLRPGVPRPITPVPPRCWLTSQHCGPPVHPAPTQSTAHKDRIFEVLRDSKKGKLPVVDDAGNLVALATRHHFKAHMFFPGAGEPSRDGQGRLLCGAAVGTRETDKERVAALVKEGVDAVILDSSQGDSTFQLDMIAHIKRAHPGLDVIAGNVVTSRQARRWGRPPAQ